eukprot:343051-Prorocentrum_minimum.AAC.1
MKFEAYFKAYALNTFQGGDRGLQAEGVGGVVGQPPDGDDEQGVAAAAGGVQLLIGHHAVVLANLQEGGVDSTPQRANPSGETFSSL